MYLIMMKDGVQFSREHLDSFELQIEWRNSTFRDSIEDLGELNISLKEYIHINGFTDVDRITYVEHFERDGVVSIVFVLNNSVQTEVYVDILEDGSLEIADNWR